MEISGKSGDKACSFGKDMRNPLSQAADQKPWLSVLIPAFNVENFIGECLDSILPQIAGDHIELIILDDASTDRTAQLIADVQARHPGQVRGERVNANIGVNEARNWLLGQARGDYIWFVDADDRVCAGAMGALRTIVAEHAPDIVLCGFRRLSLCPETSRQVATFVGPSRQVLSNRSDLLAGLYRAGHMQLWSKVFKRCLWDPGFRLPPGTHFEDIAFSSAIASGAKTYYYEPAAWIEYRVNPASIVLTMTLRKYVELATVLNRAWDVLERQGAMDDVVFSAFMMFRDRHFIICYRELLGYPPDPERSRTLAAVLALYRRNFRSGEWRILRYLKSREVKKLLWIRKWERRARRAAAL